MKTQTYSRWDVDQKKYETVQTCEANCPHCLRVIRFAVARENPLYNYRDEAESWREKCIDLHLRLDDLRRGYIPPLPEPQAKVIMALRAEIKQLRRDRQRLGRYAVENRQLKRQLRAANSRAEGYQRQAEAALRVMEELKAKTP